MKKIKGKMELRYYDVPQNEFLIVLLGQIWQHKYQEQSDLLHFHNLLEIGICRRGLGKMRLEDEYVAYKEGTVTIIPANYPHSTLPDASVDTYWEYLFVDPERVLTALWPDDILQQQRMLESINRKAFVGDGSEIPHLNSLIYAIISEMGNRQEFFRECVRGMGISLVMMIARMNSEVVDIPEGLRDRSEFDQVRPALEHIRNHFATSMKIADLAAVCHMSESHFRRLFEENLSMTPNDYLNQVRIKKACDMIRRTGYSMEEIAAKVGFSSTSTFNRNFKKVIGMSPYHWKKSPDNFEMRLADFNILIEKGW